MLSGLFGAAEDGDADAHEHPTHARARAAGVDRPEPRRDPRSFAGLKNQGATCYLNSLLQVLYLVPELRAGIYALEPEEELGEAQRVGLFELQALFARLDLSACKDMSTVDLTERAFAWEQGQSAAHHDVHELVTKLLERIHMELQGTTRENLIRDMFIGKVKENSVKCLGCGASSGRETPFTTLLVSVAGFSNLEASLKAQFRGTPERIDGSNAYKCDTCGQVTAKELSQALTTLPDNLFVNLNRFDFDFETCRRVKVSTRFEFPAQLNLTGYIENEQKRQNKPCTNSENLTSETSQTEHERLEDRVYDLVGIISHAGSGYSGHYISYVRTDVLEGNDRKAQEGKASSALSIIGKNKNKKSTKQSKVPSMKDPAKWGRWTKFNDMNVSEVRLEELAQTFSGRSCAYMLLYRKQTAEVGNFASLCSAVPKYWQHKIEAENNALAEQWSSYESTVNLCEAQLFTGSQVRVVGPHVVLNAAIEDPPAPSATLDWRCSVKQAQDVLTAQASVKEPVNVFVLQSHGPGWFPVASLSLEPNEKTLEELLRGCGVIHSPQPAFLVVESHHPLFGLAEFAGTPLALRVACPVETAISAAKESITLYCDHTALVEDLPKLVSSALNFGDTEEWSFAVTLADGTKRFSSEWAPKTPVAEAAPLGSELLAEKGPDASKLIQAEFARRERLRTVRVRAVQEKKAQVPHADIQFDLRYVTTAELIGSACDKLGLARGAEYELFRPEAVDTELVLESVVNGTELVLGCKADFKKETTRSSANDVPTKVSLKFNLVTGNDTSNLSPNSCRAGLCTMGEPKLLDVDTSLTLSEVKELVLKAFGAGEACDQPHRIRLTNWSAEPQALLTESTEKVIESSTRAKELIAEIMDAEPSLARGVFDKAACLEAYQRLGGLLLPEDVAWSKAWLKAQDKPTLAPLKAWLEPQWSSTPINFTLGQVLQDVQGSETLLLEEGESIVEGVFKVAVHVWEDQQVAHLCTVKILDKHCQDLDQFVAALAQSVLISGWKEDRCRTAALALASCENVLLRQVESSLPPFGVRAPGQRLNVKGLGVRARKGAVPYPVPIVIHCSQATRSTGSYGKGKTSHVPRSLWATWVTPSTTEGADPEIGSLQEIVGTFDDEQSLVGVVQDIFARSLPDASVTPDQLVVAKYSPKSFKWEILSHKVHTATNTETKSCEEKEHKKIRDAKASKKIKGKEASFQRRLNDGDLIGVLRLHSRSDMESNGDICYAMFDTAYDRAGRTAQRVAEASKRKGSASKVFRQARAPEVQLSLGGVPGAQY